ncbi:hypothetical protein SLS53_008317 [Cytospora paraplurivora]|uniref:Rhodopsin domain-containing protein n=1 Tax=Cytospora paraplurivora TaxID=2898453 RepID=A0AAN9YCB1_9PEZI
MPIFTNIFQCVPVQSNWDASVTAHCINLDVELVVVSSINVLTDATILLLPMPYIWRLKTDTRRKVQLTSIFLLGIFVVVVSIVRVTYVENVSFTDGFWANSYAAMWSVVENCVAIVAACLPVMRPVINQIIYGSPNGSENPRRADGNEGKFGPLNDRHIVTIGGSGGNSAQMEGQSGINVTKTTAISHQGTYI